MPDRKLTLDEIRAFLDKLTPEDRVSLEDLVLESIFREEDARRQAEDPKRFRESEEMARRVVESLKPIPAGAAPAIRAAFAGVARSILEARGKG